MSFLSAQGISLAYDGHSVLSAVDLDLRQGEVLGLIGANGAGKSSLVRVLAGLQSPERGEVRLDSRALVSITERERARRIGYLPQAAPLHWPLEVETVVELGRLPWRGWRGDPGAAVAVGAALEQASLVPLRQRLVTTLSGGERMRVMLARMLAGEPALILADEPVAALDLAHQAQVMELLRAQAAAGRGVLAVLHDLSLAARYCDRLVLLDAGRIAACGSPREVLEPALLARCYGVEVRCLEQDGLLIVTPWARR